MAQIQCTDVKPKIVTLPNCKDSIDTQQLKHGTIFVKPRDLKLQGNWVTTDLFVELLESFTFKASGECKLPAGGGLYEGHFLVGLSKDHKMRKVRTEKCPPQEEREEDLTKHAPAKKFSIAMGVCDGEYVKFSLANAREPLTGLFRPQKGLIIYGVTFTPVEN